MDELNSKLDKAKVRISELGNKELEKNDENTVQRNKEYVAAI